MGGISSQPGNKKQNKEKGEREKRKKMQVDPMDWEGNVPPTRMGWGVITYVLRTRLTK